MNNLIKSDGHKTTITDLGLPSADLSVDWPSPEQIIGMSKRETLPVAFRIDEVAYSCLDLFAKQTNMTLSAFVNTLLNSYINQNKIHIEGFVFNHAMNLYMERLKGKISKMTPDDLAQTYGSIVNTEIEGLEYLSNFITFFGVCLTPGDGEKATLEHLDDELSDVNAMYGWSDYLITVPTEKWAIIAVIFSQFQQKSRQLFGSEAPCDFTKQQKCEELTTIISEQTGTDLINSLIAMLKLPEYVSEIFNQFQREKEQEHD